MGVPESEARSMLSDRVAAHFGICLPEIEISEN
jgi:hypothetical protein